MTRTSALLDGVRRRRRWRRCGLPGTGNHTLMAATACDGRTWRSVLPRRQLTSACVAFRSDDCSMSLMCSHWAVDVVRHRFRSIVVYDWLQLSRLYRQCQTVRNQSNSDDELSFNCSPISLHTALGQLIRACRPGPVACAA